MYQKRINGDVFFLSGEKYEGLKILVTGNVYVAKDCYISAEIDCLENVYLDEGATVNKLTAKGSVFTRQNATAHSIKAGGKVFLGENSSVWWIICEDDAYLENNTSVSDIEVNGNLKIGKRVHLWLVTATGDIEIEDQSSIWEAHVGGCIYRDGQKINITYIDPIEEQQEE